MSGGVPAGDIAFLNDLAARLFKHATPMKGFDQGDTDQLYRIARDLSATPTPPIEGRDADVERGCAVLLDSLCAWLLHRFGPETPEGREALARQHIARAALQALGERG